MFASLASSYAVLSMIFGIFGKFRIDIGVQKISEIFFRDEKFFDAKKCFWKFWNLGFFFEKSPNSIRIFQWTHWKILIEFWDFSKMSKKFHFFFSKHIFRENFFISKKKSRNFSEHLCQLKICPGFQKSHLEQRAVRLKSRKTRYPNFFAWILGSRYS